VTSDKNTPDDLNTENLDDDLECMTANIDDIDVNIEDEWPNTIRKELEEKDKKKSLFQITNKFGQLLTMTEDTENSLSESLTDSQPLENQTNAATKKAVDQNNPRVSQQNEKDDNIQGTNEFEATSAKFLEGEKSAESSFNLNDTIEGEEADEGEADDDDSDDSETEIANMKAAKKKWMKCVAKLWSQGTWSDFGLNCKSKTLEWLEAFLERNKPSFPGIPEPGLGEVQEGGITSVYWDTQNASREVFVHEQKESINLEIEIFLKNMRRRYGISKQDFPLFVNKKKKKHRTMRNEILEKILYLGNVIVTSNFNLNEILSISEYIRNIRKAVNIKSLVVGSSLFEMMNTRLTQSGMILSKIMFSLANPSLIQSHVPERVRFYHFVSAL
jgi:hypothetical protein